MQLFTSNGDGTCYVSGIGTCRDENVVIPSVYPNGDKVTGIGDNAFVNCLRFTNMTIPEGVTSIGNEAFYSCSKLETVYYTGTEDDWARISIGSDNECLKNAKIVFNYVPE